MVRTLRIFISSPGDVVPERRRAQLVIEKLNKVYGRFFRLAPILWELEPMLASGHFQDQITPPSDADIVVLIVWSRLGTSLPPRTGTREYRGIDGRVPVTGTEWEFEDAVAAQRSRGAPDLLAYRKLADPVVSLKDKVAKALAEAQWEKLEDFWSRWFVDQGEFRAAFSQFTELDAFEAALERDLKSLIERRIADLGGAGRGETAATWLAGSPFRGLETYRYEHAPIFFGRSAMTRAAVEQLAGNAEHGRAFLLVLGASGSGKSSLVQAGVLPAITGRGIVPGVGLWRRAVLRPGGDAQGPFLALAHALAAETALPELLTANQDEAALARYLAAAADDPTFPIVAALDRIEEAARQRGDLLTIEAARLVLVADQLEELFTAADVMPETRAAFVRCLDGLARSGRVFMVATMRSDFWHRAAETPLLVDMAAGGGRLDLLPPAPDEILEMIRQPAQAAGLVFERDPARDTGLDATLASEAEREPGALPLLSFLLDALYQKDVVETAGTSLTYATTHGLGGLRGAIATRAEAVVSDLPADVQAALPRVLRALVTVSGAGAEPTARSAPLAHFASQPEQRLVEALLDARVRLLVADGDRSAAQIRLAHEALITHWERARDQIARDRDDLRTRASVEEAFRRWNEASKSDRSGYLLRDPLLTNARDLATRWSSSLPAEVLAFIHASSRRAKLTQRLALAAASIFAAISVVAIALWMRSARLQDVAQSNEARALAALARVAIQDERPDLGIKLALAAWPQSGDRSRPQLQSALDGLSRAMQQASVTDRLFQNEGPVLGAIVTRDNTRIVAWSKTGRIRIWNAASGDSVGMPMDHPVSGSEVEHEEFGVSLSPDGQSLLSWSGDNTLRIWDLATAKETGAMTQTAGLNGAIFGRDSTRIVTWSVAGVHLWDKRDGRWHENVLEHPYSRGAAISQDGMKIVSWSQQRTLRIWDLQARGELPRDADEPDGRFAGAMFTQDGTRVLSWEAINGRLRFWDVETGEATGPSMEHGSDVWGAQFSDDGQRVFSWSATGDTMRLWDVETGRSIGELEPEGRIRRAMLTADGRVISVTDSEAVQFWDGVGPAATGGSVDGVEDAVIAADGRFLLTWSGSVLRLRDLHRYRPVRTAAVHKDEVRGAIVADDARRVLSWAEERELQLWDIDTGRNLVPPMRHHFDVAGARFAPTQQKIVSWSSERVYAWDAATGQQIGQPLRHAGRIAGATFSRDEKFVLAWGRGTLKLWQLESGRSWAPEVGHGDVHGAALADNEETVVSWFGDRRLRWWKAGQFAGMSEPFAGRLDVVVSPDTRTVAVTGGNVLQLWDARTTKLLGEPMMHDGLVWGVAFTKDGRKILSWSWDGSIHWWDAATGKPAGPSIRQSQPVTDAVLSPDEKRILAWDREGDTMQVWDAVTANQVGTTFEHAKLREARFVSDRRVVSRSLDGSVRLWDIDTGQQIGSSMIHGSSVAGIEVLQDGKSILAWSGTSLHVWDINWPDGNLLQLACKVLKDHQTNETETNYRIVISTPICADGHPAPPDWSRVERYSAR